MKLRGEKELIADKLYNSIEEELYKTIVSKGKIIKQSVNNLCDDIDNCMSNIYASTDEIYCYKRLVDAVAMGDFNIYEIKALSDMCKNGNCIKVLYSVYKDNEHNVNINNGSQLEQFIKYALSLRAKEIQILIEEDTNSISQTQ